MPASAREAGVSPTWRNYYATLWKDSRESAAYASQWPRLFAETRRFRQALASDLPRRSTVTANLGVLKSPAVRLEDGTFYGWEGATLRRCCEGSVPMFGTTRRRPLPLSKLGGRCARRITGITSAPMEDAVPSPALSARRLRGFGPAPTASSAGDELPHWKICGDTGGWRAWPAIKASTSLPGTRKPGSLGSDQTGVLWAGNTRSTWSCSAELWLTGFYLGALKAGAGIAGRWRARDRRRYRARTRARRGPTPSSTEILPAVDLTDRDRRAF